MKVTKRSRQWRMRIVLDLRAASGRKQNRSRAQIATVGSGFQVSKSQAERCERRRMPEYAESLICLAAGVWVDFSGSGAASPKRELQKTLTAQITRLHTSFGATSVYSPK